MRVHDCFALDHVNQHVCTLGALGLGVWDSNSDQACHDIVTRAPERAGAGCRISPDDYDYDDDYYHYYYYSDLLEHLSYCLWSSAFMHVA